MNRMRWDEIDPRVRQGLLVAGGLEAGLKIVALIDLAGRSAGQVRGSRRGWALALVVMDSFGVLPLVYLLRARR